MANDFTKYDAYVGDLGLIEYDDKDTKSSTTSLPLRPPKTSIPSETEFEQSPSFGDLFSQGDFSGGSGQLRYHAPGRDPRKFFYSEGYDITDPGRLKHLHEVGSAILDAATGRALEICNGVPFLAVGSTVLVGNGSFPGTWVTENPGGSTVEDLASSGVQLYAGAGNVYIRDLSTVTSGFGSGFDAGIGGTGGAWSSHVTKGSASIDRVEWVKDRLVVSDGLDIYEITATGALPASLHTLPPSWRYEYIFEFGEFIYACATSEVMGASSIYHFGLNQALTGLELKGHTDMPRGQLAYSGAAYMGIAYLGAGVLNTNFGYDPIVYQAIADARGFLDLVKLSQDKGGSPENLSVKCFEGYGESMFMGYSRQNETFSNRTGLAVHHLGRDAFAFHLLSSPGSPHPVTAIKAYKGRLLYVKPGIGLDYEKKIPVRHAYLVASVADFNSASPKIWDTFEVGHSALPAGTAVTLDYYLGSPEDEAAVSFSNAVSSSELGSKGKTETIVSNLKGRQLTVRIGSDSDTDTESPEVYLSSVRSNPSPGTPEYVLTRYYRILDTDRKDDLAEEVFCDVDDVRDALGALVYSWVTLYESARTWTAYVTGIADVQPMTPIYQTSGGEPQRRAAIVQVQMVAR